MENNSNWRQLKNLGVPWVPRLNHLMSRTILPKFDGPTLYIVTDYSGYDPKSRYWVYSILIVDIAQSYSWELLRRSVRDTYLKNRKMSFKNLNDIKRLKALKPFLLSANDINGLCVCIAQTKKMNRSFFDKERFNQFKITSELDIFRGKWNAESLNNMWTVVSFVALLIAGFAKPNQNIYWISDEDEIFANAERASDVSKLLGALTDMYVDYDLGQLMISTTAVDEGDRFEEDLNAIPDLTAGAFCELINKLSSNAGGKLFGGLAYPAPSNLSKKSELITSWFTHRGHNLHRLIFLIEQAENGLYGLTYLEID